MADMREQAEQYLKDAVAAAAAAFNLAHRREWTFAPDVRERAEEMLRELYELFHGNGIHGRASAQTPPAKRLILNLDNPDDCAFASFKYKLTVQAKDGSFVGRRADGNRRRKAGSS